MINDAEQKGLITPGKVRRRIITVLWIKVSVAFPCLLYWLNHYRPITISILVWLLP